MISSFKRHSLALIFCILLVSTSFLFLFHLGSEALVDYDEAAYAQVVKSAVTTHTYITMFDTGSPWFDKPPLQFWMAEGLWKTGLPVEWAVRLPSALFGIATVLVIFGIVFEVTDSAIFAGIAGFILATMGNFLMTSREFKLDVPVTFFLIFGVYSYIKSSKNPRWLLGIGTSIGLAVMTKSVIGLLLIPIIIIFAIVERKWSWFQNKWFWIGNAIGMIIALPWHLYEYVLYGKAFIQGYIIFNVFTRYNSVVVQNSANVGTYIWTLWTFNNPWFLFFLISMVYVVLRYNRIETRIRMVAVASSISVLAIFGLFSFGKTIIPYYLVPLYPLMTLTVALVMYDVYSLAKKDWHKKAFIILVFVLILTTLFSAIETGYHQDQKYNIEHRFAEEEKVIGTILLPTNAQTVYFDDDLYNLTVRFYSGKQINVLDKNNLPAKPFYLVIFLQKAYDEAYYQNLLKTAIPIYKGEYIGLYKVQ